MNVTQRDAWLSELQTGDCVLLKGGVSGYTERVATITRTTRRYLMVEGYWFDRCTGQGVGYGQGYRLSPVEETPLP